MFSHIFLMFTFLQIPMQAMKNLPNSHGKEHQTFIFLCTCKMFLCFFWNKVCSLCTYFLLQK